MKRIIPILTVLIIAVSLILTGCKCDEVDLEQTTLISEIQGEGDMSPLDGQRVETVVGVVTAVLPGRGFYIQEPDSFPATPPSVSRAVFCLSMRNTGLKPGDAVAVSGKVLEDYWRGRSSGDLSITSLRVSGDILHLDCPEATAWTVSPVVLGKNGRLAPDRHIYPDGMDFYESLENMLITIPRPMVVGGVHTAYGEIAVAPDDGQDISNRNSRGGATISANDDNPEVLFIDVIETPAPLTIDNPYMPEVGDRYDGEITGVLYYSFGTYKLLPTEPLPPVIPGNLPRETSDLASGATAGDLSFATFNVENLWAGAPAEKFADLADTIANALHGPDIMNLQEVQDNNGELTDDGTTDASQTWETLTSAIAAAGGPDYLWADIAPENNKDGGAPGANIRTGFLYNPQRVELADGPFLLAPDDPSFADSRKPLAAWFALSGDPGTRFLVVNLHLTSKGGDTSPWGSIQPPVYHSEERRLRQTQAIVAALENIAGKQGLSLSTLPLIIAGDMNEFYFRSPLQAFINAGLVAPAVELLPQEEIYSYVYQHNSQALDHVFISPSLWKNDDVAVDYVHRYSEYLYGERMTDHDPLLMLLTPKQ